MKAVKVAIALLLVPRLFLSLIFFPLLLSLLIIVGQMFVTRFVLRSFAASSTPQIEKLKQFKTHSLTRSLIFGSSEQRPQITLCRWIKKESRSGVVFEVPPGRACAPDRLDAAVHVPNPESFDPAVFTDLLNGSFDRLHLCESQCRPDVIITPGTPNRVDTFSFWGLMLVNDAQFSFVDKENYVEGMFEKEIFRQALGNRYLHSSGLRGPISIQDIFLSLAVIVNFSSLILISLWLALKAHRRVLDYFSRCGALLPMVAATGHRSFYGAMWLLTGFRVGAFILAAVPVTLIGFGGSATAESAIFKGMVSGEFEIWIGTMVVSMCFATLVASIADLKHRHHLLSFLYKFLPLLLSLCGGLMWASSFVFEFPTMILLREIITALPLVGMAPVILAPMIKPKLILLGLNAFATTVLIIIAARSNSRWFAAHLEEL